MNKTFDIDKQQVHVSTMMFNCLFLFVVVAVFIVCMFKKNTQKTNKHKKCVSENRTEKANNIIG